MLDRRSALRAILASCSAPAFIPVERIMRIKPIVVPSPRITLEIMQEAFAGQNLLDCLTYELQSSVNDARRRMIQDLSIWEPPNGS